MGQRVHREAWDSVSIVSAAFSCKITRKASARRKPQTGLKRQKCVRSDDPRQGRTTASPNAPSSISVAFRQRQCGARGICLASQGPVPARPDPAFFLPNSLPRGCICVSCGAAAPPSWEWWRWWGCRHIARTGRPGGPRVRR